MRWSGVLPIDDRDARAAMIDLFATAASAVQGVGSPAEIWQHIIHDFSNITSPSALSAFVQVLMIDVLLAAGLPAAQRKKVILIGILAALVLRIAFALVVSQLMQIVGLILAGGLLLLWVSWKMWRELHPARGADTPDDPSDDDVSGLRPAKSFAAAAWAVAVADVSMSLDNVLAVAGAARDHPGILMIGLVLSVALMGIAANVIAHYIERFRWIAYLGLAVIIYVALKMIYEGFVDQQVGLLTLF